ncbi:MAG: hypothetical protein LUC37_00340 [Prevotella sp.]|nr:hypothetical protein [Prevotella sp.]
MSTDSLQGTLDIGDLTLLDGTITLNEEGLEGADAANPSSRYDIRNDGVYFSTDGGETWDYGVGAEGINMNYATIGQLDSSKVQIVDGDYIYFLWDKDGINAYRNPAKSTDGLVDFARFNRYGLSLIENNNVRLRAGYEFVSSVGNGTYTSEKELSNQNIGFYLYNDNGQAIFKTETQSAHSDDNSDYSARLSLTGEIFVTNQILSGRQDITSTSNYTLSGQYTFLT